MVFGAGLAGVDRSGEDWRCLATLGASFREAELLVRSSQSKRDSVFAIGLSSSLLRNTQPHLPAAPSLRVARCEARASEIEFRVKWSDTAALDSPCDSQTDCAWANQTPVAVTSEEDEIADCGGGDVWSDRKTRHPLRRKKKISLRVTNVTNV